MEPKVSKNKKNNQEVEETTQPTGQKKSKKTRPRQHHKKQSTQEKQDTAENTTNKAGHKNTKKRVHKHRKQSQNKEEALNIKEVKVYSARKLEEKNRQEIINAISNKYKSDVELIEYINPELVAGIKVVIGGKEIDTTFRKRVDLMKKELLKEGW